MPETAPVPTTTNSTPPTATRAVPPVGDPRAKKTDPRPTATGAIRTLGANPATAPIMLHPGDSITARRRVLYIILLGALTALGPFTIDLYLPAFPVLEADFQTSAAAIQLTLSGTMIGFALGQLIVGRRFKALGKMRRKGKYAAVREVDNHSFQL